MADNFTKLEGFLSGQGGKGGQSSGAGLLPAPVNPAWYDVSEKAWYGEKDIPRLSKKEKNRLIPCSLFVQYAPTGRAGCRRCGEKIDKDQLRLGYPFRWRSCEDAYTLYLHPGCYVPEVFGIKEKELPKKILGYKALSNTEKNQLWKAMKSSGKAKAASSEGKAATTALATKSIGTGTKVPEVKVPKEILAPMLPFQREGLSWMCHQETTDVKGGILADEMGMGKTIQAISLLCARRLDGPALVVVPMAAVSQWVSEIQRFTKENTLAVMVYHGAQRSRLLSEFKKVDVVVTTYQTLESDYRQQINKTRVACKWCKKLFLPEKLAYHQKYFCGPDAVRTQKQQRTQKKDKGAAQKAMQTMGIGQSASSSSVYAPPTITNIYKDYMKQAGVDIKSSGYWNVRREAAALNSSKSSSSSCKAPKSDGDHMSRERLSLLDRSELNGLCEAKGLDKTGRKADLVDRLMEFTVKGMAKVSSAGRAAAKSAAVKLGGRMLASAKAKAKAKAKSKAEAKMQAQAEATKGKKGTMASSSRPADGSARTVASQRAAASSSKGKPGSAAGKGKKRKLDEETPLCQPCGVGADPSGQVEYKTYVGAQIDLSNSPLHAIQWSRIILDEAHRIKGRTNSTAMAAYALQSDCFKWCLSGTPLQNRVGELYALVRFLRIRPFAFYYCKKKGCNCECARFMRDRYCPNCGHVRFMHFSHFKRNVSNPIIKFGYMGAGKTAFSMLRNDILGKAMLRRTKEERKKDLKLPGLKISIRKDALSKQESDFYASLYMQSQVKFDTYIQSGTVLHNYAHIFDLLTSLRRAVDHPYLIVHGGGSATHKFANGERLKPKTGAVCGLCQDDILEDGEEVKRTAKCGHAFHDDCIRAYILDAPKLRGGGVGCPVCFTKLSVELGEGVGGSDDEGEGSAKRGRPAAKSAASASRERSRSARTVSSTPMKACKKDSDKTTPEKTTPAKRPTSRGVMSKVRASEFQSSTKIEALLDEVKKMMKADKSHKAIVFSQFGGMLELVEFALKRAGISCVVFRGGMTMQARDDALRAFNEEPSLKVILISLKAGGEGLNLQVANHVFLLDPWWNPACELQAIQRAHRIGQTREVRAVRFVTKGTIEEKITALQEKKQLVFDASIDGSAASLGKLTEQDLRFLFQH